MSAAAGGDIINKTLYKCSLCKNLFWTINAAVAHELTCSEEPRINCSVCSILCFNTDDERLIHEKTCKGNGEPMWVSDLPGWAGLMATKPPEEDEGEDDAAMMMNYADADDREEQHGGKRKHQCSYSHKDGSMKGLDIFRSLENGRGISANVDCWEAHLPNHHDGAFTSTTSTNAATPIDTTIIDYNGNNKLSSSKNAANASIASSGAKTLTLNTTIDTATIDTNGNDDDGNHGNDDVGINNSGNDDSPSSTTAPINTNNQAIDDIESLPVKDGSMKGLDIFRSLENGRGISANVDGWEAHLPNHHDGAFTSTTSDDNDSETYAPPITATPTLTPDVLEFLMKKASIFRFSTSHCFSNRPACIEGKIIVYQIVSHCIDNPDSPYCVRKTTFSELRDMDEDELSSRLEELQSQLQMLLASNTSVKCFYSGQDILLQEKGGAFMLSIDQVNPNLQADQEGQSWVISSWFSNSYKNVMNPSLYWEHMSYLTENYDPANGTNVHKQYEAGEADEIMEPELSGEGCGDNGGKLSVYVFWKRETINLGTFPLDIAKSKKKQANEHMVKMKKSHPDATKVWVTSKLESLGVREVLSHGGHNKIDNELAPPIKAIEGFIGSMRQAEIKRLHPCEYKNTEEIRRHFMACKNTCIITGMKLDMKVNPLSLDRKVDNLSHSRGNCQLIGRYLNLAKGHHEAFKSEEALSRYCEANTIQGDNMYEKTCRILRPIIEDMIKRWKIIGPIIKGMIENADE